MGTGIGARVARKEDARLLCGQAKFVGDLRFPRLFEAAYVRSPLAHGLLKSVTVPEKFKDRVFTASDLTDVLPIRPESSLPGYKASEQYPLAKEKVRFVGECIAVCVAPTRAEAEDIAEQVVVDIDPLPPLVDASDAKLKDAPRLHEDWLWEPYCYGNIGYWGCLLSRS